MTYAVSTGLFRVRGGLPGFDFPNKVVLRLTLHLFDLTCIECYYDSILFALHIYTTVQTEQAMNDMAAMRNHSCGRAKRQQITDISVGQ